MGAFVASLARPYRAWLVIILLAMLAETLTALIVPWPLKVVIDSVVGGQPVPDWVVWLGGPALAAGGMPLAATAAISLVLLAMLGGMASYLDNYFTENVGQWVANDLRIRVYQHLEHLSFTYYDTHQTGVLLSTVTEDVSAIQDFVSSTTLSILIESHDDRRDARFDVLAQLGLHTHGRGGHAVSAAVRRSIRESYQKGDP
jgi:subfamily B ATP-binding cassette protein MsbA